MKVLNVTDYYVVCSVDSSKCFKSKLRRPRMTVCEFPHWEAHFWVGGREKVRPSNLGVQNSESQSRFCELYVSPCWEFYSNLWCQV